MALCKRLDYLLRLFSLKLHIDFHNNIQYCCTFTRELLKDKSLRVLGEKKKALHLKGFEPVTFRFRNLFFNCCAPCNILVWVLLACTVLSTVPPIFYHSQSGTGVPQPLLRIHQHQQLIWATQVSTYLDLMIRLDPTYINLGVNLRRNSSTPKL